MIQYIKLFMYVNIILTDVYVIIEPGSIGVFHLNMRMNNTNYINFVCLHFLGGESSGATRKVCGQSTKRHSPPSPRHASESSQNPRKTFR